jgi:hypothetical protein
VPAKDPEKRRATVRAWYARTRHLRDDLPRRRVAKNARKRTISAWLDELKTALVCNRCGEKHPGCLVFHHTDPSLKEQTIADAVRRGWGLRRIRAELAKCEVLCANCHLKHHAREKGE